MSSKITVALCFLVVILFVHPHQAGAQETGSDVWSNWMSYIYVIREDRSAQVTIASYVLVDTATAEYLEKRFDQNKQSQLEVAQQTVIAQEVAIADRLGRRLALRDLTLQARRIENLFAMEISWTWDNFAVRKGNSWVIDALSVVPVTLEEKGNLTVTLPKSVDVIAVSLKEDERLVLQDSITLVWKGPRQNIGPIIEYSTFWDRYQIWVACGALVVVAVSGIVVYARKRKMLTYRRRKSVKLRKKGEEYPKTFCAHCGAEIPYGHETSYCIECGKPIRKQ